MSMMNCTECGKPIDTDFEPDAFREEFDDRCICDVCFDEMMEARNAERTIRAERATDPERTNENERAGSCESTRGAERANAWERTNGWKRTTITERTTPSE